MRQLKIVTADQVAIRLTAAGLATRAAAWLVDQALLVVIRVVVLVFLSFSAFFNIQFIIPLLLLLDGIYFTYFEWTRNGQTWGKQRLNIRVVNVNSSRLTFQDVLVRNVVRMVDNLPFLMVVGGVCSLFDPLGRRLGDLAAGTMVIIDRKRLLSTPAMDRERPNSYRDSPALRRRILARADKEDRDLAIDLMWRRDGLDPTVREELFAELSEQFKKRFSLPEDENLSHEQVVMDVALILADEEANDA